MNLSGTDKTNYDGVIETPYSFASVAVAPSTERLLKDFDKNLVVSGFNFPDLEAENNEMLLVQIKEVYTDKETGDTVSVKHTRGIEFSASDLTGLRNDSFFDREVTTSVRDEEGNYSEERIEVPRVKMYKQMLRLREISVSEMLTDVLKVYAKRNDEIIL